ncbi:glycosyltransferase family 4 protein [Desertivirga arenae]|uniref:glycosyltransferase family 4 protein n=1 Tax=Desertivirga arenae TaxID=2810309 RepID=UPI001A95BC13|nr:glycosyltransferase family 1 protein [Pedobacter sp. SYSU D00823]
MINRPANILVTLDSMKNPNTGLFYFGYSLAQALLKLQKKSDLELNFYLPKKGTPLFKGKPNTIRHNEFYKYYFPKRNKFDLTHFTDQICRLKPTKVLGKKIITIHDLNVLYENKELSNNHIAYLERLGNYIGYCDRVVAISKFVASDILKHFPQAKNKIEVVYNGADELTVDKTHIPDYLPQKPFIFSIGELLAKKNFHVLPALLEDNDYELVISGNHHPSDYESKIVEAAQSLGFKDRLKITGPITDKDKAWYYNNCLAFAFPSIAEGFGLPIIEAMHFGKPVFLSTHTAVPEVGGDAAFYFKNFSQAHMQQVFKEGLEKFNSDPTLKQKAKLRAAEFTWEKAAASYLRIYDELLNKN